MRARRVAALGAAATALGALLLWRLDIPFPSLARRYADASSRWLALPGGVTLHYRDRGPADAPVLLCLHGYSASSLDWLPWAERLERRYRVLLVDLPGHGLTRTPRGFGTDVAAMAALVQRFVTTLGLARVVLIGNSMGGQVAMTVALAHPATVSALVLVASIGTAEAPPPGPPPLVFRLLASRPGRFALRHLDLTPMVRGGLRNAFGDPRLVTPALVRQYTDLARAPGHRAILTGLQLAQGDPGLLAGMRAAALPVLVMTGDADRLVPLAQTRALAGAVPGATLIVYPGIGHVPMQQIPDRSARDLETWLGTLADAPPARAGG